MNRRIAALKPADHLSIPDEPGLSREVVTVPISALRVAYSPRLNGVDPDHIRTLADIDLPLPPICVHYPTMSVIDGMHRLSAARLKGRDEIEVRYFHGTEADAFRLAVRANVTHGLPLTTADREAAAARMVHTHPEFSDRSIAANTGLSAKKVAAVRGQVSGGAVPARLGQDGRVRPLSTAEGRRIASEAITARPEASLREIAREAGISVGTVRDVRARVQAGEDPVPRRQREQVAERERPAGPVTGRTVARGVRRVPESVRWAEDAPEVDIDPLLNGLRHDPSLRYTDCGRTLLRWLGLRAVTADQAREAASGIPPHCGTVVARIARECARVWLDMADELERRTEVA